MKKLIPIILLSLGALDLWASENYVQNEFELWVENHTSQRYIDQHKSTAIREMKRTGIPASIKLAQAILESNWGKSTLATRAKNHFGIKCHKDWSGKTFYIKDDDYDKNGNLVKSCFRVYDKPKDSFVAHSDFLKDNSRYHHLFSLERTDYKKWARGLKKSGYATSSTYDKKLIQIIEQYHLNVYDENKHPIVMQEPKPNTKPDKNKGKGKWKSKDRWKKTKSEKNKNKGKTKGNDKFKYFKIRTINGLDARIARENMSLETAAERLGVAPWKLMKINDCEKNHIFKKDDNIFLQQKEDKFKEGKKKHLVVGRQSMHYISQRYGIKLKELYRINKMEKGEEPYTYEHIYLKGKRKKKPRLVNN